MPMVTLITDYGTRDFYAGALKGAIFSQSPDIRIVDVSHHIDHFNIAQAAFVMRNAYPHFPEKTIHVVSVNDIEAPDSRYLAIQNNNHFFLGSDNGLFSLVFDKEPELVYELYNFGQNGTTDHIPSNSIFANAIRHLREGHPIKELGKPVYEISTRTDLIPVLQDSLIRGTVIYVDSFQNAILNIRKDLFTRAKGDRRFVMFFKRNERISEVSQQYFNVPEGEKLCRFNEAGYMEIAINKGKAGSLLGLQVGDTIQIDFE